jgi:hypothetical protein
LVLRGLIIIKNNYRIDLFFRKHNHYQIEFPEYWLAKAFADAIKNEDEVTGVFLLQRLSTDSFDVTEQIK